MAKKKFNPKDLTSIQIWLSIELGKEWKDVIIEIRKANSRRSLNQNAFLWGVVYPILSDYFGYTTGEMHQICSRQFLSYFKGDSDIEFVKSTKSLSTMEFEQYIENIRRSSLLNHNIKIPLPNEVTDEMLIELSNKYS